MEFNINDMLAFARSAGFKTYVLTEEDYDDQPEADEAEPDDEEDEEDEDEEFVVPDIDEQEGEKK